MNKIIFIMAMLFCPNLFAATLTANKVPYASQGGTTPQLSDSNIYYTGWVGIGTSGPQSFLDVRGPQIIANSDLAIGSTGTFLQFALGASSGNTNAYVQVYNNGDASEGDLVLQNTGGDVYTSAWSDYSASSTIMGWSSITSKTINIKKIGKTVFVQFYIFGTSNSTSTSFTVPYTTATTTFGSPVTLGWDNGGLQTYCIASIPSNGTVITLYYQSGSSWTASGSKLVQGQFSYQTQ